MKLLNFMGNEVTLEIGKYQNNGHLAIELKSFSKGKTEPYARLTVNLKDDFLFDILPKKEKEFAAFVDTNNVSGAEEFINMYKLGKYTGFHGPSGWVKYPLYIFDKEKLKNFDPKGFRRCFK